MKTIIAATIAVALSAPAFAADLGGMKDNTTTGNTYQSVSHSWSGPYIGVHGGYGWNSHDVKTTHTETVQGTPASCKEGTLNSEGTSCTVVTLQSVDTDGLFGGARVGADYQPSGSRLVFGVLGDFNLADNKQLNEELGVTIHDKNSYLVAGRIGALANDKTLVYGLVGYGWQNVTYAGDEDSLKKTFGHVVAGGGVEYKFTDTLSARLEAQHWFETTKTLVNEDDSTEKDSRSDTRVLVGVNWRPEIN